MFVGVFGGLAVMDAADGVGSVELDTPYSPDIHGEQAFEGVIWGAAHHTERGVFGGLSFDYIARCIGRNNGHLVSCADM